MGELNWSEIVKALRTLSNDELARLATALKDEGQYRSTAAARSTNSTLKGTSLT